MALVQTAIDPRPTGFKPWGNAMRLQNSNLPETPSEDRWQIWAQAVCQFEPNAPNPRQFRSWQDWATAWMQAV